MTHYKKEIELIDDYCKFLDKQGCEYKREVRRGSYHSEGYIDILIKKKDIFIAVEAKLKGFQAVLYQAIWNLMRCELSYILYPRTPRVDFVKKCRWGNMEGSYTQVGVIIPNGKDNFLYLLRSKPYGKDYHSEKIERNWNENRVGRPIHEKELPDNYDREKIEKLKPDYKWVKRNLRYDDQPLKKERKR